MASTRKRGNCYQIRVCVGRDEKGDYLYESKSWTPPIGLTPRKEAAALDAATIDFERLVKSGRYLSGEKITLREYINTQWLPNYAKPNLKPKTYADYQDFLEKRILPALGEITLSKIQPSHIIRWLNQLDEKGMKNVERCTMKPETINLLKANKLTAAKLNLASSTNTKMRRGNVVALDVGKKVAEALHIPIREAFDIVGENERLSENSKGNYFRCLSSALSTAVQWQIITENPCKRVKAPSQRGAVISHMDIDEAQKAYQAALQYHDIRVCTSIIIFLQTGIREGELAGLEWKDINFEKKEIHIQRNSQYVRKVGIVTGTPKTISGNRTGAIADDLLVLLKKYRNWQKEERLHLGDQWQVTDRLFTAWNGRPINNQTISKWNKKFLKDSGFKYTTVHGLRHTYATLQIAAGTNVRTLSELLGHANVSTTMNIYSHSLKSSEVEAAQSISRMLRGVDA